MEDYRIELQIDGKKVKIEVPYIDQSLIKLENYAPFPKNDRGMSIVAATVVSDFEYDIKSLIPRTLQGSPFDNSVHSLFQVVERHIKTYGSLMPSDLYTYINESILIILTISDQLLHQKLIRQDGEFYFEVLFKITWRSFSKEMKELYINCAVQDPMTNYILRSLT
jgi:hypothetical protein